MERSSSRFTSLPFSRQIPMISELRGIELWNSETRELSNFVSNPFNSESQYSKNFSCFCLKFFKRIVFAAEMTNE